MNQRFITTTTAVALFGVAVPVLGQIILSIVAANPDHNVGKLSYTVTFVLNLVLGSLFSLHVVLKKYARVLTTYLDVSGLSKWEKHWAAYRRDHAHVGYSCVLRMARQP